MEFLPHDNSGQKDRPTEVTNDPEINALDYHLREMLRQLDDRTNETENGRGPKGLRHGIRDAKAALRSLLREMYPDISDPRLARDGFDNYRNGAEAPVERLTSLRIDADLPERNRFFDGMPPGTRLRLIPSSTRRRLSQAEDLEVEFAGRYKSGQDYDTIYYIKGSDSTRYETYTDAYGFEIVDEEENPERFQSLPIDATEDKVIEFFEGMEKGTELVARDYRGDTMVVRFDKVESYTSTFARISVLNGKVRCSLFTYDYAFELK